MKHKSSAPFSIWKKNKTFETLEKIGEKLSEIKRQQIFFRNVWILVEEF